MSGPAPSVSRCVDQGVARLYRFARALRNYGNPLTLAWQLGVLDADPIEVRDRSTGLSFLCRSRAFQMFGEVFHLHLYDIPWVPIRPGDVVIDIGANHGFYSLYAAAQGAIVHAFEPQRDTLQLLRENVRRNHLQDRIVIHPCAVGECNGTTQLAVSANLAGGMSSINPAFTHASGVEVIDAYDVDTITLSSFLQQERIKAVRCLKLDCEGAELMILGSLLPEHWSRIESLAAELHPEAYPAHELFDLICATHQFQIGTIDTRCHFGVGSDIFHCARTALVRDWLMDRQ